MAPQKRSSSLDTLANKALLAGILLVVGRGTHDDQESAATTHKSLKALQETVDTLAEEVAIVKRSTAKTAQFAGDVIELERRIGKLEVAQNRTRR